MKKVVAYCRVSTEHEDQKNSLVNQRAYFEEYVKQHKEWKLVEVYADEGISGTSLKKRVAFNRMYADGMKKNFDIIVTKEVCRFARNTVDTLEKTRELKKVGVEVKFIIDNISTFDTDGELRLTIMAGMAQDESRRISERVQFGVIQSMKRGVAFGNIVYGYDFVRDEVTGKKTKLVVNKKEAKIVRRIFDMYLYQNMGYYMIAKKLDEEGVEIKRPITKKKSTDWRQETIQNILQNVKYVGDLKQRITYTTDYLEHSKKKNNGEVEFIYIKNHHEPIIDRDTFNKVQEELKRRSAKYGQEKQKYAIKHTFSGKLVCGHCGASFVAGDHKKRKDGSIRKTWRCYNAIKFGKEHKIGDRIVGCNNTRANDTVLKIAFSKILKGILKDRPKIENEIRNCIKNNLCRSNEFENGNKELIKEREQVNKEKDRLLNLYLKSIIDENTYKLKNDEITERLDKIELEILKIDKMQKIRTNTEQIIEDAMKVVDNILNMKKFSECLCREFVDKVVIHSRTEFDFYLKGYTDPIYFDTNGNILSSQH